MKTTLQALICGLIISIASCGTIHEYPDEDMYDASTDLSLTFKFLDEEKGEIEFYPTLRNGIYKANSERQTRYVIEIYRTGDEHKEKPIARQVHYTQTMKDSELISTFSLPIDEYSILVWVDHLTKENKGDLFYSPNVLTNVLAKNSIGCDKSKESFSGAKTINLTYNTNNIQKEEIELHRPMGKFRIVATDYGEYKRKGGKELSSIVYTYHSSLYSSFNVFDDSPHTLVNYQIFDAVISADPNLDECIVALDWVLTKENGAITEIGFDIYNEEGERVNEVPPIQFPIKRDVLTIIKGKFLTHQFGAGGIGIDDEFEEEIEIILPD